VAIYRLNGGTRSHGSSTVRFETPICDRTAFDEPVVTDVLNVRVD